MTVTSLPPTTASRPLLERIACSLGVSVATTLVSTSILVLLAVTFGVSAGIRSGLVASSVTIDDLTT